MKTPTSPTADCEGFDLDSMLCTRCTLGCNVFRIVSRGSDKIVLCGKKRETQKMLDAQGARLGVPAPGQRLAVDFARVAKMGR